MNVAARLAGDCSRNRLGGRRCEAMERAGVSDSYRHGSKGERWRREWLEGSKRAREVNLGSFF